MPCGGYLFWRVIAVRPLLPLTLHWSARFILLYVHAASRRHALVSCTIAQHERYTMHIDILYFEGCPNHVPTVERVKQIVADMGLAVTVAEVQITTPEDAQQRRFLGSPTVLVNGVDIDPTAHQQAHYGLSCRVYPGVAGLPPEDMIRAALHAPPPSA